MRDIDGVTHSLYNALLTLLTADDPTFLPPRRFVAQGLSAWDSEQFTVSFMGLQGGQPSGQEQYQVVQDMVFYGDFRIEIARKAPSATGGKPPTVASQTAAAAATNRDILALLNALQTCIMTFVVVPVGVQFTITSMTVQGPEGGMAGAVAEVQIALI